MMYRVFVGALGIFLLGSGAAEHRARGPEPRQIPSGAVALSITVIVRDRSSGDPMKAILVKVVQTGKEIRTGITGPTGSVTIGDVSAGSATVFCEKDGYQRKPESHDTVIRKGSPPVQMTLLDENRDTEYFRRAGKSIEAEALTLPPTQRDSFYQREWGRVKLLRKEYQIQLAPELRAGKPFLAKDVMFREAMVKSGRGEGSPELH
jgi:hypothetical protein